MAYARSLLLILFRPNRAARGLAVPDRLKPAIRWASVHVLCVAALGLLLTHGADYSRWLIFRIELATLGQPLTAARLEPGEYVALWAVQSFVVHVLVCAAVPLIGVGLALAVPGRHPAARFGLAKWSLYSAAMLWPLLIAWYGFQAALLAPGQMARAGPITVLLALTAPPIDLLFVAYSICWSLGAAANPYLRRRGFEVFWRHLAAYNVAWMILGLVLFPLGPLWSLM